MRVGLNIWIRKGDTICLVLSDETAHVELMVSVALR
jgi:hypothetical protein